MTTPNRETVETALRDAMDDILTLSDKPAEGAEKRLMCALYRAFPDSAYCKETCPCECQDECTECLTRAELDLEVTRMEMELSHG